MATLRTKLGGYSPVIKQFLVVLVGFNQGWVQLKHFNKYVQQMLIKRQAFEGGNGEAQLFPLRVLVF